jgi:hypothetical protein
MEFFLARFGVRASETDDGIDDGADVTPSAAVETRRRTPIRNGPLGRPRVRPLSRTS